MKTKHRVIPPLLRAMACVLGIHSASADATEFRLQPTTLDLAVGESATVDLYVGNYASEAVSIAAVEFALMYDTALLAADGVVFGPYLGGPSEIIPNFSLSPKVSGFALSLLTGSALDALQPESFLVASITFRGLAEGSAFVALDPAGPNSIGSGEMEDVVPIDVGLVGPPVSARITPASQAVPDSGSSVAMLGAGLLVGMPLLSRARR